MPLFVCPKETVYAPYPSLLCAHLHFLRISAHCLLPLCILPINHSAQSRPPTEAMSPPPPEMREWQVCSVGNIHPDNRRVGTRLFSFHIEEIAQDREWKGEEWERSCISTQHAAVVNILLPPLLVIPDSHMLPLPVSVSAAVTVASCPWDGYIPRLYHCSFLFPVHLCCCWV